MTRRAPKRRRAVPPKTPKTELRADTGRPLFIVDRERADIFKALTRSRAAGDVFEVVLDRRRQPSGRERKADRRIDNIARDLDALGFAVVVRPPRPAGIALPPEALRALKIPADRVAFLGALAPFKGFTPEQLSILARRAREWRLKAGQALFREGEQGGEMFFVQRGTILISKVVTGKVETVLRRLQPGEFFGEMSLLGALPRTGTAKAETDAVVLGLDRASLVHVIELSSRAALSFFTTIVQQVSQRLATTEDAIAEVTRWGLEAAGLRRQRSSLTP